MRLVKTLLLDLRRGAASIILARKIIELGFAENVVLLTSGNLQQPVNIRGVSLISVAEYAPEYISKCEIDLTLRSLNELIWKTTLFRNSWQIVGNDRNIIYQTQKGLFHIEKSRHSLNDMVKIFATKAIGCKKLIDTIKPDFIITLDLCSLEDQFITLFGSENNIPILHMLPTRFENFVCMSTEPVENFKFMTDHYDQLNIEKSGHSGLLEWVDKYIALMASGKATIHNSARLIDGESSVPRHLGQRPNIKSSVKTVLSGIRNLDYERLYLGLHIGMNLLRMRSSKEVARGVTVLSQIPAQQFWLFALHSEPETAVDFYMSSLPDQRCLIKVASRALPFGDILVVREHPRMHGMRSSKWYRKIQDESPNVVFISNKVSMNDLLKSGLGSFTICGSAAVEALSCGKPVCLFGHPHFVRLKGIFQTTNLDSVSEIVSSMMTFSKNDEEMSKADLRNYIMKVARVSYRLNWWSDYYSNDIADDDAGIYGLARYIESSIRLRLQVKDQGV